MALKQLGKLQQGTEEPLEFGFYGFKGGLNVKGAPQMIDDEDLTIATNGYLRPDGAFQLRNGMQILGPPVAGGAHSLYLSRFFQDIKNGAVVSPEVVALLGVFNGSLYGLPTIGAATLIGSVGGIDSQATFVRFQDPNNPNFPAGLTDVIVICTGHGGPYIYDGFNLYTPAGWASVAGAQWCCIVNGIVWFGGLPLLPNQIFGTGDGITASMESLPAYRNFIFSTPVFGLVALGAGATANLVVGLNSGIGMLSGTGPSTFYLQEIAFSDGVTAGRTMVFDNGLIFFLGHNAVFSFDGQTTPKQISQKIEPWILNDPLTTGYPMTGFRQLSWAAVYNNRLHVGYCSSATTPNVILTFDLIVGGWTVQIPTPGIASMCLLDAPSDPNPAPAIVGSSQSGQAYTWDFVTSSTGISYDGVPSSPVLAEVQSKFFKIGVPGTSKTLLRYYPEFLVAGIFSVTTSIATDYGATTGAATSTSPTSIFMTGIWDSSAWDLSVWDGQFSKFSSFGSPASRLDFNVQADSFAFGVVMSQGLAPWIWSGATGAIQQGGRA